VFGKKVSGEIEMAIRKREVHGERAIFRFKGALALILIVIFGAFNAPVWGQGSGSIGGSVSDETKNPIAGGTIQVKNLETGLARTLTTDDSGRYEAPELPVGAYEVTAEKAGFRSAKAKLAVVLGQRATVDLELTVAELQQSVQVQETAVSVEVTTMETSGLVGERQVKDLPLNGRSYDQLLTLNPGVVNYTSQRAGGIGTSNSVVGNMFSASGRRPQENLYLLNGVEYTSASEINSTPGGVSGQLLGVDAVREFSVVTDTYGAEYGKRPGAQINIVTASGSNAFHGSAYEFLRNSALDARNFFDFGAVPEFQRNEFGGSLGGPIQKNKSFFFVNYEGFRQNLALSDVTLVPDSNPADPNGWAGAVPSIKALESLWPVSNGPVLGGGIAEAFSNPKQRISEDFASARLDHTFSEKDTIAAAYTLDASVGNSPTNNPMSYTYITEREQVASLSETHVFSAALINRATIGFSRGAFYFNSSVKDPAFESGSGWINAAGPIGAIVVGGGTTLNGAAVITNGGTNAGSNLSAIRNLFTISDQVTLTHGKHLISGGVWVQPIQANDTLVQDQYGQASFSSLANFLKGSVSTYTYAPGYTPLGWRTFEAAFFLEDSIRLKPSVELTIGFRGESTNGWNEQHGRASNYLFNSNGVIESHPAIGQSALNVNNAGFLPAPRAAIAWSPFKSKKTVLRAGFGVYYDLLDNLSYRLDQNPPFNAVYAVKAASAGAGKAFNYASIGPTTNYSALGVNNSVVPSGVQPNLQTPTVESYTLKIEQQLPAGTTVSAGYIGSHGYRELLSVDENLPGSAYPYPTQTITATSTGLANPEVWNTTNWNSEGVSAYNALQLDVNHRASHGLQIRGVYTFGKALDDGDSLNTSVATNSPAFAANPLNPKLDYGAAAFDIRHSAVISATYDLPFGRGRNAWERRILGDWRVSGIETLQSGLPFTPQLSYNPSNDGDTRNPVRPSWNPAFTGSVIEGVPNQYFNAAAFMQPASGTYGSVGRNVLTGPGLATLDLSLAKKLTITERVSLQFRSEFFNIFNAVNFNNPNPVVFSAAAPAAPSVTAGVITSTSTTSRQIQFGMKLLW
jgi:hypothetical protein